MSVVIGLSAFSQSPSKSINLRPAYPVAIGEKTVEGVAVASNGLYLHDTPSDSLPQYEIGHIYTQTVRYTEDGYGFYVKADSLHSLNVTFSYEVNNPPKGNFEFNEKTGRFKYYPTPDDYEQFVVTFTATSGASTITEDVAFNLMPPLIYEENAMQSIGTMPSSEDYVIVASSLRDSIDFNNKRRNVYSFSISGKDIVFDNRVMNKVSGIDGREDILELNIFAERLIVRTAMSFPQTNVTINAEELIFEDTDTTFASINTTPSSVKTLAAKGQTVANGNNAGNINLYVKTLSGNNGKRFIMNGGKGQNCNKESSPGNGGNGGTMVSTIDVSSYCDFARGCSGLKFGTNENKPDSVGGIIGAGKIGFAGHFELIDNPYLYLHPFYVGAVLRQVNDAYINEKRDYTYQACDKYHNLIEEYMNSSQWENVNKDYQIEFKNQLNEIDGTLMKLDEDLDYFGNPVGWVPLLSFEVMLNNYNAEIDRAIPTLYMYYWLSHIDNTLQANVEACQFAASEAEKEIARNQKIINELSAEIPVLHDQCDELTILINETNQKIKQLEEELMRKARKNVKKRGRIKKGIKICQAVVSCIPTVGPALGVALNVASNMAYASGKFSKYLGGYSNDVSTFFANMDTVNYVTMLDQIKGSLSSIELSELGKDKNYLQSKYSDIEKTIAPLMNAYNNLNSIWSQSSAPQSEVNTEFERLKSESAEFKCLTEELDNLNNKKTALTNRYLKLGESLKTALCEVSNDVVSLDVLRRDVFTNNSKRDLNAMQYLEKMQQRAKNRLLKYHYYLRKAYEYRLLKPYQGEFNLVDMYKRFENLGMALGDVVDAQAHASLAAVFRDVVSEMAEQIIDEYSNNYPEQSAPITIVIPKEQLDVINNTDELTLNFHEMGVFAPDEENVRIVKLGVKHIESHVDGNVGYTGYMDLNMTHSGISLLRKDGQIYWFNHISKNTTSPHTWGIRYDAITHENTTIEPSAASASLLYSILNGNNIMLFSRPSAWGDINLTKKVHTSGGGDIVIDSLVLSLQYDFTRRPNKLRNIDITTNDGMMPYIACSESDLNGRNDGEGNLYRSYYLSSQPVTFTAVEKYGTYHFLNWTDRAGRVVSEQKELTVNRMNDQFYTANYERRVPILSVPDTIMVSAGAGKRTVKVLNVGSGDLEMDWEVSDSLSTWVQVEGLAEGIDDGTFTLKYGKNTTGAQRIDILEIYAPETDEMVRTIHIVQGVPIRGDVNGDGIVNGADVTSLYSHLLTDTMVGGDPDVNEDGIVNGADVTALYTLLLQ